MKAEDRLALPVFRAGVARIDLQTLLIREGLRRIGLVSAVSAQRGLPTLAGVRSLHLPLIPGSCVVRKCHCRSGRAGLNGSGSRQRL
jgi:hypothetical protein